MQLVLTSQSSDPPRLAEHLAAKPAAIVIGLCAAWCHTCGEFLPSFERLAEARPDAVFVWLDIEDDSTIVGDVDVENFPSLVFRGDVPVFFGPTLPQEGVVERLLGALALGAPAAVPVPEAVRSLPAALARLADPNSSQEGRSTSSPAPRRS